MPALDRQWLSQLNKTTNAGSFLCRIYFYFLYVSHIIQLTPQQQSAEPRNSAGAEALAVARRPKEASSEKLVWVKHKAGEEGNSYRARKGLTRVTICMYVYIYITMCPRSIGNGWPN